jgi:uncharacterized repeat protein (TIGR03803 family)
LTSFQRIAETRGFKRTRWLLSLFCAASVAGCAGGTGTIPMASAPSAHVATRSRPASGSNPIIYAFTGVPDGSLPYAGLIDVGGTLYGTTGFGGTEGGSGGGYGTVFSVTLGGSETVLHSFAGGTDGIRPYAGLIDVKGTLYGTASGGGSGGNGGTVFSITTSGTEKVLYSFKASGDGQTPYAGLLYVKGALYGTTIAGGTAGDGTVFKLVLTGKNAGKETVLHNFTGGSDGYGPQAALIQYKGDFYGTTFEGGGSNNDGTVFKVTPSGQETIVHAFAGTDGSNPVASLLPYHGMLYGMTDHGGAKNLGTVFKMTPKGKLTVIHSFTNVPDEGWNPLGADLINVNGTFYGTVSFTNTGSGGLFAITPSGSESLIYIFNGNDGGPSAPYSGVINVGGTLYGTTINGGPAQAGTVYGVPL